jgi:4-diphosphocytidyl-2-C-methyl-D-erythritol kinase
MTAPRPRRIRTNAKVNLFLRVVGRRPDGYHELETILHGVRLADEIQVVPTTTGAVEIDVELDEEIVGQAPAVEENLIWQAAGRLIESGARNEGVRIRLKKRIPIGAGLGGGSGNGAGALVLFNEMWGGGLDRARLIELAAEVGSDVPYCIGGGTALATGRGEKLTALAAPEEMWFVLGISNEPLPTSAVYESFDSFGSPADLRSAPITLALGSGDARDVASLLHNDLEQAAFKLRPELAAKKETLLEAGALGACMTGSGPTLYGIASDEVHARSLGSAVEKAFDRVVAVKSQPECIEFLD